MHRVNIATSELQYDDEDPEGFRAGLLRPGRAMGARATGASVYDVPPGQAICPYHYEVGEEEWLAVLTGAPTLRTPEGEDRLAAWDVVFFPAGREGAHQVRNDTDEPVRVLMFSNVIIPTATVYPDSDKLAVWTPDGADNVIVRRSSGVGYYDGERT
jgi:uncharacterized cupin superfamily protein